jgi:hypothetical protein
MDCLQVFIILNLNGKQLFFYPETVLMTALPVDPMNRVRSSAW